MEDLAGRVGEWCRATGEMLVSAESCTGGGIAQAITSVAGSSGWFERGFVTYSGASKHELLGVAPDTLARSGAVSEETACEMAAGGLARSHGTVCLAVTGIAGPGGGSAAKPVGMVCFAWARRNGDIRSETRHFRGDRESVRQQSVNYALQGLLHILGGG